MAFHIHHKNTKIHLKCYVYMSIRYLPSPKTTRYALYVLFRKLCELRFMISIESNVIIMDFLFSH